MAQNDPKTNRGRSGEARDPNRPIDPETGEKEGLGRRDSGATGGETGTGETEQPEQPEQPAEGDTSGA